MGLVSRKLDVAGPKASRDFEGLAGVLEKSDEGQRREVVEAIVALGDPRLWRPW